MKVIHGLKNIKHPIKASVLTIGVFDGVHAGHRAIIKAVVKRAEELNLESVVLTFDPHPSKVTHPGSIAKSLISLDHRIRLIEALGVETLLILKFTAALSKVPADHFARKVLAETLGAKEIFVSENFYFGKGADSGIGSLKRVGNKMGFRVRVVPPVKMAGHIVSSSRIRSLIMEGELRRAAGLLGRPVSILGTVVKGHRRGRILGFPTANINPHHEAIPPSGVYAVRIKFGKKRLNGLLNIGIRPTFHKNEGFNEPTIEVHIFNFDKKIYGRDLELTFVKKLRNEKKFATAEELIAQIREDEKAAHRVL
ncbi:MAG: bifunctional riboflavin kinase/FAD synthetase [Candidatus Omnitrophica bacterium]|nr:bifunctional riboflavin kinase/FAD synthetase [Candidatus Omnitrophota bacterium]